MIDMRHAHVLAVVGLLQSAAFAQPVSVSTLWKAHGLDASERLSGMDKESVKTDAEARFRFLVDLAYSMHADPEASKNVVRRLPGVTIYMVAIPQKGEQMFALSFGYASDGTLLGTQLETLPSDWKVLYPRGTSRDWINIEATDGVVLRFKIDEPFTYEVGQRPDVKAKLRKAGGPREAK
jgi:hypothetical protein